MLGRMLDVDVVSASLSHPAKNSALGTIIAGIVGIDRMASVKVKISELIVAVN